MSVIRSVPSRSKKKSRNGSPTNCRGMGGSIPPMQTNTSWPRSVVIRGDSSKFVAVPIRALQTIPKLETGKTVV